MGRLRQGRKIGYTGVEPVYYFIFPPSRLLYVKRQIPALTARLRNDGWNVHLFSVAEHLLEIFRTSPLRKIWLAGDRKNPLDWEKTNKSLANALETTGVLESRLENKLEELKGIKNALLIIIDVEALHPYTRFGVIEGKLQGKFHVPTVILYPGESTGKTRLKFLKFYQEDGNYRSTHIVAEF